MKAAWFVAFCAVALFKIIEAKPSDVEYTDGDGIDNIDSFMENRSGGAGLIYTYDLYGRVPGIDCWDTVRSSITLEMNVMLFLKPTCVYLGNEYRNTNIADNLSK